jgi:hypothetical protein
MPDVEWTNERSAWLRPPGLLRRAYTVVAVGLLGLVVVACGSSSSVSASAEVRQTCQQVEAVLGDGPEPVADPVGYAQAQVLPLRQIHTSDDQLHQAIDVLASAYATFSADNGARSAKSAVRVASKMIDAICPGVVS